MTKTATTKPTKKELRRTRRITTALLLSLLPTVDYGPQFASFDFLSFGIWICFGFRYSYFGFKSNRFIRVKPPHLHFYDDSMKITDIIKQELIVSDLEARNKKGVLEELVSHLALQEGRVNREELIKVLLEREKLGSTGINDGWPFPMAS